MREVSEIVAELQSDKSTVRRSAGPEPRCQANFFADRAARLEVSDPHCARCSETDGPWTSPDHDVNKLAERVAMRKFLLRFFTWWNGQTLGTQLWTWLYGELVGEDEFGNRYFRTKGGKIDRTLGFERRWVIYNGIAEASAVPPSWHGWLHHTVDLPPTEEKVTPRPWWKPHRPNLTGTPGAHRPTGSTLAQGRRPRATGDYKPWRPENQ
jgi:NADH:ubiquinone oxidoreductase subunit